MYTVFVFKTSVNTRQEVQRLQPSLDADPAIQRWHVDIDDCDKVLRIETTNEKSKSLIINRVKALGFQCMELE